MYILRKQTLAIKETSGTVLRLKGEKDFKTQI
jgi:hypothetical protein